MLDSVLQGIVERGGCNPDSVREQLEIADDIRAAKGFSEVKIEGVDCRRLPDDPFDYLYKIYIDATAKEAADCNSDLADRIVTRASQDIDFRFSPMFIGMKDEENDESDYPGCEYCDRPGGAKTYRNQALMPIDGRVRCIDRCISHIVAALNAGGVRTVASCCGHKKTKGVITLADGRVLIIHPGEPEEGILSLIE